MSGSAITAYLRRLCHDMDAGRPLEPFPWRRALVPLAVPVVMGLSLGASGCEDAVTGGAAPEYAAPMPDRQQQPLPAQPAPAQPAPVPLAPDTVAARPPGDGGATRTPDDGGAAPAEASPSPGAGDLLAPAGRVPPSGLGGGVGLYSVPFG